MEAELGMMWPETKKAGSQQMLEEVGMDSPLEPLEGVQPCQHLDFGSVILIFRLLTSKTVREYISVNF